ncbi:MAG: hypothetical protein Q8K36_04800, partial [Alphaproteobacteria bacterium]|nr:hypothetical protein [Alphaproteobacteria bacterium]
MKDKEERYNECAKLFRESDAPEAKCNYARLLSNKKFHKTWYGGVISNDQQRFDECTRLYKETGLPEAKYHYAMLLKEHQVHNAWDTGELLEHSEQYVAECLRLLKESGTPDATLSYLSYILFDNIRQGLKGEMFRSNAEAFLYVLDQTSKELGHENYDKDYKAFLQLLACLKLMQNDQKMFDMGYTLYQRELTNGNPYIKNEYFSRIFSSIGNYSVLNSSQQAADLAAKEGNAMQGLSCQMSASEGDSVVSPDKNDTERLERKKRKERRAKSEAARAAQAKRTESSEEDDDRQFFEEQKRKRLEAWQHYSQRTKEQNESFLQNIKIQPLNRIENTYDFMHYRVVCDDGSDYVTDNSKIKELISAIKSRSNSGQVHALTCRSLDGK